jgi:uncharacterized protein YbdZ (MbtH family)
MKKAKAIFDGMEWLNNELMIMAAHRYCLGRQSYIVSSCIDWLNAHWSKFSDKSQILLLRDTLLALMDRLAGSETVDAPLWKEFCEQHWGELTPVNQENIISMLSHRNVSWPLSTGVELWPHNMEKEK